MEEGHGIGDGLMGSDPNTPIDDKAWAEVPEQTNPTKPIAFSDDRIVRKLVAERRPLAQPDARYEVPIIGEQGLDSLVSNQPV